MARCPVTGFDCTCEVGCLLSWATTEMSARDFCKRCGATPIREVLDGEPLCQACCVAWVRAEGLAAKVTEE